MRAEVRLPERDHKCGCLGISLQSRPTMRTPLKILLASFGPLFAIACGGGPDIDKTKADFENPSGSVGSKEAVIAANGERGAGGPAIAVAGGGVPGAALVADGGTSELSKLNVMRNFAPKAQSLYAALRAGSKQQALATAQTSIGDRCADSEAARQAYSDMIASLFLDALNPLGGDLDGSASYEIDLSSCSEGQLSGRLGVEIEVLLAENRFKFTVTESFDNVCETMDAQACVSGDLIMEAAADSTGMDAANFTFVSAWELDTKWNDNGTPREATVTGGLRIAAIQMGSSQTSSIEYLFYVTPPDGDAVSYVFRATADEMGNATFEVRGHDGSISCSINNEGGSCTSVGGDGTVTLTWTAADEAALSMDYYEG